MVASGSKIEGKHAMTFTISYLWSHPQIHGGAPMVRGSRVTLETIHERVENGEALWWVCDDMELSLEHTKKAYKEWLETKQ